MPTQPTNQPAPTNVSFGQRIRDRWWQPNRSAWRNIAQIGLNVVRSGGNPLVAGLQTLGGAAAGEAREGIGNFARQRGLDFNPFNNRSRDSQPEQEGTNRPPPVVPRSPDSPPPAFFDNGSVPGWDDRMYNGSNWDAVPRDPAHLYGGGQGVYPVPGAAPPTQGRQGQAGRFGHTIAEGQAAVDMARSFARTGLGASTYGRDRMMQQNREG
jgi:hypothetical protein